MPSAGALASRRSRVLCSVKPSGRVVVILLSPPKVSSRVSSSTTSSTSGPVRARWRILEPSP